MAIHTTRITLRLHSFGMTRDNLLKYVDEFIELYPDFIFTFCDTNYREINTGDMVKDKSNLYMVTFHKLITSLSEADMFLSGIDMDLMEIGVNIHNYYTNKYVILYHY